MFSISGLSNIERFGKDAKYIEENLDELREKYSGEYIGVYEEEVVAHGELIDVLEELNNRGIKGQAYVPKIFKKGEVFIINLFS